MCRLYGFRATEPTKVECSLVLAQNALLSQSRADLRGKSHADGWGIATYENSHLTIEKRETSAFGSEHFSFAAERTFTRTVLAHVRRATVSVPSRGNTHPFAHSIWSFAHNGTLRPFERVGPRMEQSISGDLLSTRRGDTDSEMAFLWLLTRMAAAGLSTERPCEDLDRLVDVVREAVDALLALCDREEPDRPAVFNLLLSDGQVLLASRSRDSLHWVERDGLHDCEICGIPHIEHTSGHDYRAVVVASEPITHEVWQSVPEGAILVVDRDARAALRHC